ncbi:MAG: hypothetical protein QOF09_298 [Alphaproteobacteria bacterium]|jgi:hypothetical protein|nr:hypothetical protein [Alphaproteobacteria bacterium]
MSNDSEIKASDTAPATDGPLMIEGPKAAADTPIIDLEAVRTAGEGAAAEAAAPASRWRFPGYAPLAAVITVAVALGAIAGAAATASLSRDTAAAPAAADATRALQASVAQLATELTALKAGIANAQRTSSAQFGKLTERLDRSDKALAEPTAKLARIQETIDRLDHRPQQAAAPAPEVTGSVTPPKEESRPQIAEGWRLRDFYDGRAIVESRNGTLFRIGPGSNVPGLGKVETIKRENGKVVVVTANGIIAASLEERRPSYYYRW